MQDVRNAITVGNRNVAAGLERGDANAIASLYIATAKLLPPNSDIIEGFDPIRNFWQSMIDRGIRGARLESFEVRVFADNAIELGRYQLKLASGEPGDSGKYIVMWKNVNGVWKRERDIWNSSLPAHQSQSA